jgi:amino acid adenylation domain-containing protein
MSSRVINDNREILKQILLKKASKVTKEYTLAYGQQALWYVYKQNPESSAYNLAYPSRIKSDINIMALRRAFQKLVNRHDSLRTIFCYKDGKLVQTVNGYQQVDFKVQDVKGLREKEVFQRVLKAHRKPFNLETGPLFRVNLFSCDNDYILLISAHHIILDFESFVIINNELWKLYEGEIYGIKEFTNIEDIQYIDFVNNQKNVVESPLNEKHWNYWENKLEGDLSSLSLPLDKKRPPIQTFNGSIRSFTVSKEVTKSLKKYASEEGVTLFVLLQAVYQLFLHRYSGQDDIIIGIPVNGRNQPNFNKIVGYLVNMLPVRVNFKENKTFRQLLQEVRTTITEALKHQDYPFVSLVDRLKIKRDSSRSPIFQATFEYLNYNGHNIKDNQSNLVLCEEYDLPQQEGQFDMILTIEDTGDYLNGKFNYNTDLFNEETIKNMIKHFNILLEGIVDNSNTLISHLPILTDEEINKQLIEYNQTKTEYSLNKCIHTLFEEKAKVAPNSIALVCEDIHMSYDTLNKKANQLARRLRIDGIRKDSIVGIMVNRSVEFIVGILAVLKAGGAYLPIDPTYPNERIKLILEDSGTDILLTMRNIKSVESFEGIKIYLDDKLNYEENNENLDCINKWDNLAYIIYTSGSTGKPKGAMIEHKGVVNYITWAIRQYGNKDGTGLTFPLYSSISFDLTVTSIFTPLLSGNTIIIYGENDFCLDRIVKEDKVDVIKLTPSHLKALIDEDINSKRLKSFIVGGEEFETKVAEEIENKFEQNIIQYNEYGPTETVVGCMIYAYNKNTDKDKAVPIGIGSDNVKLYIFDQYKRLVPDNVIGELYIGGDGVCRGYLNRPDLTSEKFIENPILKVKEYIKQGILLKEEETVL